MTVGALYKVIASSGKSGEPSQLLYTGARLPKDVFRKMRLADDVLREAEAAASQLRERSADVLESWKRSAYTQGYSQGHAQAIATVLGTLEIERRVRELLSHRLADIVEHCVRGLIGELGDARCLRQRVLHLLRTAGVNLPDVVERSDSFGASSADAQTEKAVDFGTVTLYVCPAQLAEVLDIVADSRFGFSGRVAGLTVVADERRAPDALLLETRLGFVESDLELTLQDTRNLVQRVLDRAIPAAGDAE